MTVFCRKRPGDLLPFDDVLFILLNVGPVDIYMRIGMVAELKTAAQPFFQHADPDGIGISSGIQFFFIDEACSGNPAGL
ncbi:hypothetical protein D9M69_586270 [compost metagenome]